MHLYASLDAQEVLAKGRKVSGWRAPVHLVGRPSWKFIEKYVTQQGFKEGIHGLVLSAMAALGVFLFMSIAGISKGNGWMEEQNEAGHCHIQSWTNDRRRGAILS